MITLSQILEPSVYVNEKTRIDANNFSFTAPSLSLTAFTIDAGDGSGAIDVLSNKFLDVIYSSIGVKSVVVVITTDAETKTYNLSIEVLARADIEAFSTDNELSTYEPDIMKYLPANWGSWVRVHERSAKDILDDLDAKRIWDKDGNRYEFADILEVKEVKQWAIFRSLKHIFEGLSNQVDDIFSVKAAKYGSMATEQSNRTQLRLDYNKNAVQDDNEKTDMQISWITRA